MKVKLVGGIYSVFEFKEINRTQKNDIALVFFYEINYIETANIKSAFENHK